MTLLTRRPRPFARLSRADLAALLAQADARRAVAHELRDVVREIEEGP